MSKPHVISKEDFKDFQSSTPLASNWPLKKLSVMVCLSDDTLRYVLDFKGRGGESSRAYYQNIDDAIEAYNNV